MTLELITILRQLIVYYTFYYFEIIVIDLDIKKKDLCLLCMWCVISPNLLPPHYIFIIAHPFNSVHQPCVSHGLHTHLVSESIVCPTDCRKCAVWQWKNPFTYFHGTQMRPTSGAIKQTFTSAWLTQIGHKKTQFLPV